jgi:hypothetical protein
VTTHQSTIIELSKARALNALRYERVKMRKPTRLTISIVFMPSDTHEPGEVSRTGEELLTVTPSAINLYCAERQNIQSAHKLVVSKCMSLRFQFTAEPVKREPNTTAATCLGLIQKA